jgi:U3 small nucleolar RNA-associated protein 21
LQQRNKPKEPPKPLEKAPFFLPTLPGVEHRFAVQEKAEEVQKERSCGKRLKNAATEVESTFLQKLLEESASGNCE